MRTLSTTLLACASLAACEPTPAPRPEGANASVDAGLVSPSASLQSGPTLAALAAAATSASAKANDTRSGDAGGSDAGGGRWDPVLAAEPRFTYRATPTEVTVCDARDAKSCATAKPGFTHPAGVGYSPSILGAASPDGALVFVLHPAFPKGTGETYRMANGERVATIDLSKLLAADANSCAWNVRWVGTSVQVHNRLGSGPVDYGSVLVDPMTGQARDKDWIELVSEPRAVLVYRGAVPGWTGYVNDRGDMAPATDLPRRIPLPERVVSYRRDTPPPGEAFTLRGPSGHDFPFDLLRSTRPANVRTPPH